MSANHRMEGGQRKGYSNSNSFGDLVVDCSTVQKQRRETWKKIPKIHKLVSLNVFSFRC